MTVKIDILPVTNFTCTYHEKLSFGDHFSLNIIISMYKYNQSDSPGT